MSQHALLLEKIVDLESRLAFQEDTIAVLSDQLAWQGKKLANQERDMLQLLEKLKQLQQDMDTAALTDTPQQAPPHY